jgi:hypothetical protein
MLVMDGDQSAIPLSPTWQRPELCLMGFNVTVRDCDVAASSRGIRSCQGITVTRFEQLGSAAASRFGASS